MELRFRMGIPALFFLLGLSSVSWAQYNASLDSLLQLADDPQRLPASTILLLTDQLSNYPLPLDHARISARISSAFLDMGQLDSAASNAWDVLTLVPDDKDLCSTAYLSLGLVAYQKSALERASDFFEKSLRLFELLDNKNGQLVTRTYLARIADRQARYIDALQNYEQCVTIALTIEENVRLEDIRFELASVYRKLRRYPESSGLLNQSLITAGQQKDTSRLSGVIVELGRVAEDQADFQSALDYYFQAMRLPGRGFSKFNDVSRMYGALSKLDTASAYADSAEVAAMEYGRSGDLRTCFQWRYKLAEQMLDTAKAFTYYKRYVQYDDSVKQADVTQRIQNVRDELILGANEASIRTAELEQKLTEQHADRDRQWQNFLFLLSGSLALVAMCLFFWFRSRSQNRAIIREKDHKYVELTVLKEKWFTVMAHDLQGPVSAFTNLTHGFARQTSNVSPEDTKSYFHNLNLSGLELTRALNQLLEWAVTQSGTMPFRPELVNCRQVAEEVERQLCLFTNEKQLVVAFLIPEALHAYGDRTMITIVLRTLLYNAIRFTSAGRSITLFSGRKDDLITLGVKDNGEGIPPERIKSIFKWSNDAQEIGQGRMGIGIPMCKELVSRNGGNLYVESALTQGSTFYFTLPEHGPVV